MTTYRGALWGAVVAVLASLATPARVDALCQGDCNGDGRVAVNELVRAVNVALDTSPYRLCPPSDVDGDQQIAVNELIGAVNVSLASCPGMGVLFRAPALREPAGPAEPSRGVAPTGRGVLPNGRIVEPAGRQIPVQTFPLNLALTPDGSRLLVTNDGWGNEEGERGLQVIDLATDAVTHVDVPHYFGLAIVGERVFVSDADGNRIWELRFEGGQLVRQSEPFVSLPAGTYPTGLAANEDYLYVVGLTDNSFWTINLETRAATKAAQNYGNFPYTVLLSADGTRAYVTSWGIHNANPPVPVGDPAGILLPPLPPPDPNVDVASSVAVIDLTNPVAPQLVRYLPVARSLAIDRQEIFGGSHPSAMALSPDGALLYVTATNLDLLIVIDTATLTTVAEVPLNLFESGPLRSQLQGVYPNALAVSADGRTIFVAEAGINAVQVILADPAARTFTSAGLIPTGWFPSALALDANGTLYVANGKGAGIGPNGGELIDINLENIGNTPYYIGRLVKGSVSVINQTTQFAHIEGGTGPVRDANGFAPAELRWVDGAPASDDEVQRGNPVPIDFGSGPSDVIQHVVFILKENRTYDQVYGAFRDAGGNPAGNGDPELVLFGEDITPNHHAVAREFAMGDNFYNDGEVSIPGHEWTDQGNTTDFTEKLWPRNYNGNLNSLIVQFGQEGFAKGGYIFEALETQGVPYRVYGETFVFLTRYTAGIDRGGPASMFPKLIEAFGSVGGVYANLVNLLNGNVAALQQAGVNLDIVRNELWPNVMVDYPSNILANRTDVERAQLFMQELEQFEERGELPNFLFLWLPNDHTFGAAPSNPTPDSAVADNDAGLGMIIDALSHSSFWPRMAIFVSEDDAQDGQDHVSAHRTLGLVASPYVKRGYISPIHHSNVSMLKTIELLLGLPPRSQYDRYATDMRDYFTTTADVTPFVARARRVPPAVNPSPAAAPNPYLRRAAEMSGELNLELYDTAGENLSQVLWLVHIGERIERERKLAVAAVFSMFGFLIAGGVLIGRRRAAIASPL